MRKASIATTDTNTGRRQSGRQARTSTSRPINYYARTFGQYPANQHDHQDPDPPGFFPAIQYFADSIAALPREVQRHVTLMKEVEAKVYGPTEALKLLSTNILSMPVPPPRNQQSSPRLLTFTAPTSATNSMNGSVVNGSQPGFDHRPGDFFEAQYDEQTDRARRSDFQSLRHTIGNLITNIDEKNVVMAEANRALAQQLARLDSVIPHIENEISEDSRLGSLSHWAYADNRTKKQTATTQHERNRRDVAATSSLAAAAAAVHDQDIAAARGEARRETKKTARNHAMDSDFDDRPTKRAQTTKSRKGAEADTKTAGLGIANGTSSTTVTKRRKVDKEKGPLAVGAPAMERSASNMSAVGKTGRGGVNTTPRSTPAAEPAKKKTKPGPAPGTTAAKKRYATTTWGASCASLHDDRNLALNQGANSPRLNSSPVLGNAQLHLEGSTSRPTSSRVRQNSGSNLQHSLLPEKEASRPASVSDNKSVNGSAPEAVDSGLPSISSTKEIKNGAEEVEEDRMNIDEPEIAPQVHGTDAPKHEDVPMEDNHMDVRAGRASITSTPRMENFPIDAATSRTRSVRGNNGNGVTRGRNSPLDLSVSSESRRRGRRKSGSGAHILKQIASFNRSPDADRRRDDSRDSEISVSFSDDDGHGRSRRSHPPRVTTVSRNRRGNGSRGTTTSRRTEMSPEADEDTGEVADEEEVEADDPDDPNEPKYCYCGQGSFGEMIACDNDECPMEWFHLGCTGLRAVPGDNGKSIDVSSLVLHVLIQASQSNGSATTAKRR